MPNFYYIQAWFKHTKQCLKKKNHHPYQKAFNGCFDTASEWRQTLVECHANYSTVHQAMYEATKTE